MLINQTEPVIQQRQPTRTWLAILLIVIAIVFGSIAATAQSAFAVGPAVRAANEQAAAPADPSLVLGNKACVKCHASEISVWEKTPHARTFDELHRRPEASQIARKLGIQSIRHGDRCVACHYTMQHADSDMTLIGRGHNPPVNAHAIAGISCESCHGPAKNWLDAHHDYGGEGITRLTETREHREQRLAKAISLGMRNPHNVYLVAQSCYRCHTTADEELVNIGGHSPGSLDFEFVAWSQGTIHHNFVSTEGKQNVASSPERLRYMFVAGVIAEVESSLRGVAAATEKATFGVTVAKRAARAGARLQSLAKKIDDPRVTEAAQVFASVKIRLNNREQLLAAADRLAKLGFEFAETESTAEGQAMQAKLQALDRFIPDPKTWK